MSSLFKKFKTDAALEQSGIPIRFSANDDGSVPTFYLRRRGPTNQLYAKELQRLSEPHRRAMELNVLDEKVARQLLVKTFCLAILVRWENVLDQKNQQIAFNFENAIALFTELPDLFDELQAESSKLANFILQDQESITKNS